MQDETSITRRYQSGEYLRHNPTWDSEDAPWKAGLVLDLLRAHGLQPRRMADIGCGSGAVLRLLQRAFPEAFLDGFDVAPDAQRFWSGASAPNLRFRIGDFFELAQPGYDLVLALDVVEHLPNSFEFLERLRSYATYHVFHFPLDLSAITVLREKPLLLARRKVGHINYYTKGLVLALLEECGYQVIEARYTGAALGAPRRGWRTRVASVPRRIAWALNRDWGVRLLGGDTLMVLARPT